MFPGYDSIRQIWSSERAIVYRARRINDGTAVVIKTPQKDATEQLRARFVYEARIFDKLRHLEVPNTPLFLERLDVGGLPALVIEDLGGASLREVLNARKVLGLREALQICIETAKALRALHHHHFIHRDINPSNIVINSETQRVQLIDFAISTALSRESQSSGEAQAQEGTPAYLSPEQTGRLNRAVDYRTDLYALGATMFELLTGRVPYDNRDLPGLIHAILAASIPSARLLTPSLPPVVDAILAKLLAKDPQERYQSAHGLLHDLERCTEILDRGAVLGTFDIATEDRSEKLQIAQKLYGREQDLEVLQATCSRVMKAAREVVVICGPSGIGKTALVKEAQLAVLDKGGIFLSGKFEQLRQHLPYGALSQCLSQFVRWALQQPEGKLKIWQRRLQEAVGAAGQVVLEVVPTLEKLIGPQPQSGALNAQQTESRLRAALLRLVNALCKTEPVVFFFDDLQWADVAMLQLIGSLAQDKAECAGILMIAAYRDNEVTASHPLMVVLNNLRQNNAIAHHIVLKPLAAPHVEMLLCDALHCAADDARPLAELVMQKTGGNPFFVLEFVAYLVGQNLLVNDLAQRRWVWQLKDIAAARVTDNVVELLISKMQTLPQVDSMLLSHASLLGSQFSLGTLSRFVEIHAEDAARRLESCLEQNMLIPLGMGYKYIAQGGDNSLYKFAHDRVQQAAYEMLPSADRQAAHLRCGRFMLQNRSRPECNLFSAVGHLNAAIDLQPSAEERTQLLQLNLEAAKAAKRSTAYNEALDYLGVAQGLLDANAWASDYDTKRDVMLELADNEMLTGAPERASAHLGEAIAHARSIEHKGEALCRRVNALFALGRFKEAALAGAEGLRELGYPFSSNPPPPVLIANILRVKITAARKSKDELAKAPLIENKRVMTILELLRVMMMPAHFSDEKIFVLTVMHTAYLSMKYGNSPYSALGYAALAIVAAKFENNFSAAQQWRDLSRVVLNRVPGTDPSGFVFVGLTTDVDCATLPGPELIEAFERLYLLCFERGLPIWSGYSGLFVLMTAQRMSLRLMEEKLQQYEAFFLKRKEFDQLTFYTTLRQFCRALQGGTSAPFRMAGEDFDEKKMGPELRSGPAGTYYLASKCQLAWHERNFTEAVRYAHASMDAHIIDANAVQHYLSFFWYAALSLLEIQRATGQSMSRRDRKLLAEARKRLRAVRDLPQSCWGGLARLLEAEEADVAGQAALPLYAEATAALAKESYLCFTAAGYECAGRAYLRRGMQLEAHAYLSSALVAYGAWGARVKVAALSVEFEKVAQEVNRRDDTRTTRQLTITQGTLSGTHSEADLDVPAIMRAAEVFGASATTEALTRSIITTVREVAGAGRVLLAGLDNGMPTILGDSANQPDDLPHAVLALAARGKEIIQVDDAQEAVEFKRDPYIAARKVRSFLCAPLLRQNQVVGLIYLENNLASGAFSARHLTAVRLIATQAAIALENSFLQERIEGLVHQRTETVKEAHTRQLRRERHEAEMQMAGGFAHEMGNALAGAGYALEALGGEIGVIERMQQAVKSLREDQALIQAHGETLETLSEGGEQAAYLYQRIHEGVQRGQFIVARVLEYAQIGAQFASDDEIDLRSVVDRVLEQRQDVIARAGIAAEIRIPDGLRLRMKLEHAQAVIDNLVRNACEALETADQSERRIMVRAGSHEGMVTLSVDDTGPGMPPTVQARLFEPFFTTKGAKSPGLGLGLSKKIIELYGGSLRYASQPGQGAHFEFEVNT